MEIVLIVVVVLILAGLIVYALRYSNWMEDNKPEIIEEPDPGMGIPHITAPAPVAGWEWRGLEAHDALSLIQPDVEGGTYTVRINDDNTFSVRRDT